MPQIDMHMLSSGPYIQLMIIGSLAHKGPVQHVCWLAHVLIRLASGLSRIPDTLVPALLVSVPAWVHQAVALLEGSA